MASTAVSTHEHLLNLEEPINLPRSDSLISYKDFQKAQSIEDLKKIYVEKGVKFSSMENFIAQVESDWKSAWGQALQEHQGRDIGHMEPDKISVDGRDYLVYSVSHTKKTDDPDYFPRLVEQMRREGGALLCVEHGLTGLFERYAGDITEINDHVVSNPLNEIAAGIAMKSNYRAPKSFFREDEPHLFKTKATKFFNLLEKVIDSFPNINHVADGKVSVACQEISRRLGFELSEVNVQAAHPGMKTYLQLGKQSVTIDAHVGFMSSSGRFVPEYVDLDLKKLAGIPFSPIEKRSAYMAEMLRRESDDLSVEKAHLVCGALHGAQVLYFLKNGVPDDVKKLASQAQKAFYSDPMKAALDSKGEIIKSSFFVAIGYEIAELIKAADLIPGARKKMHDLLTKAKIPTLEQLTPDIASLPWNPEV